MGGLKKQMYNYIDKWEELFLKKKKKFQYCI